MHSFDHSALEGYLAASTHRKKREGSA